MGDVPGAVSCERHDVPVPGCLGCEVAAARDTAAAAAAALREATVEAVRSGALSQVAAARVAGVDRHTLRGWLGLPRKRPGRPAAGG